MEKKETSTLLAEMWIATATTENNMEILKK